ncbi:hypothetical protein ACTQ6A_07565 [Lachnospiraceae bacterium LCP25S3_G4]
MILGGGYIRNIYTKQEIINLLDKSKYASRYKQYDTCLEQHETRWKYGHRFKYEEKLRLDGIRHFAFIKFYLTENGDKIGLVAGKSASKIVIGKSDLNFSLNPKHGPARRFLEDKKMEWCKTEVIIIGAEAMDNKENRKEAFEIERDLKSMFNLFGS